MQQNVVIVRMMSYSSSGDQTIFEEDWSQRGCNWTRAEVNKYTGLRLFYEDEGMTYGLHFVHSVCGFTGTGPMTSAKILAGAGFGKFEDLLKQTQDKTKEVLEFVKE